MLQRDTEKRNGYLTHEIWLISCIPFQTGVGINYLTVCGSLLSLITSSSLCKGLPAVLYRINCRKRSDGSFKKKKNDTAGRFLTNDPRFTARIVTESVRGSAFIERYTRFFYFSVLAFFFKYFVESIKKTYHLAFIQGCILLFSSVVRVE